MKHAIGLDIGGTQVKAVCVDEQGVVVTRVRRPSDDAAYGWQAATADIVAAFERDHGTAAAIGVSCPGIVRADGTAVAWMTGRMSGLVGFDFTQHLNRPTPVPVLNDALAALVGEAWVGAARDAEHVALFTLGTGVGGALMAHGRLLRGHTGRAGHLGHMTVNADGEPDICRTPGSIEMAIGDYTVADRTRGHFRSTEALVRAVESGDAAAATAWRLSIRQLAAAIVSVVNAFDPQRVLIGGGIASAGLALLTPLRQEIERVEWRPFDGGVEVMPCELGEWAGAIGAARNAFIGGKA